MLVTDEMVNKAAREGCDRMTVPEEGLSLSGRVYSSGFHLRAALEAVAPAIRAAALEEIAARFEARAEKLYGYLQSPDPTAGQWGGSRAAAEKRKRQDYDARLRVLVEEAAAIRALKDKEPT